MNGQFMTNDPFWYLIITFQRPVKIDGNVYIKLHVALEETKAHFSEMEQKS